MKLRSIAIYVSFILSLVFVFSYSILLTKIASPPPGNTNSPADNGATCAKSGCHAGSAQVDNQGLIKINIGTSFNPSQNLNSFEYAPNTQYNMLVDITNFNKTRFGFEISALNSGNMQAGSFAVINSNNTSLTNLNNIQYVGHKNAGGNATWLFEWTSPSSGSGPVTFYVAANGANGDGTNSGDEIYIKEYTVSEESNCTLNASLNADSTSFCQGDSLDIRAMVSGGSQSNLTFKWSGGTQADDSTIVVTSTNTFQVTVTDTSNGCSDTSSLSVVAQPSPSQPVISKLNDTLFAGGVSDSVTFQWMLNAAPLANATDSVFVAQQSGVYSVIAKNPNGCYTKSDTVTVQVTGLASMNRKQSSLIRLNNVTQQFIALNLKENANLQLELYDVGGRQLFSALKHSLSEGSHRFQLPDLTLNGQIVLLRIQAGEEVVSRKIFFR